VVAIELERSRSAQITMQSSPRRAPSAQGRCPGVAGLMPLLTAERVQWRASSAGCQRARVGLGPGRRGNRRRERLSGAEVRAVALRSTRYCRCARHDAKAYRTHGRGCLWSASERAPGRRDCTTPHELEPARGSIGLPLPPAAHPVVVQYALPRSAATRAAPAQKSSPVGGDSQSKCCVLLHGDRDALASRSGFEGPVTGQRSLRQRGRLPSPWP
jgi:hypothetical protein